MQIKRKNLPRKERIFSRFLDYFLILVGTIFLELSIVSPLINNVDYIKKNNENFYVTYNEQEKIISETRINDVSIDSFLAMAIKAKLEDKNYFLDTNFVNINPLTKDNDVVYFYFTDYKVNHIENYLDSASYNVLDFLKNLQNSTIFEKNEDYYSIKEDVAISVGDYIFNNNPSKINTYNEAFKETQNLFLLVSDDLKINNKIYSRNEQILEESSKIALSISFVSFLISFTISYLIFSVLIVLVNKKHKSVGNYVFKIEPYFKSNKIKSLTIRSLIDFFVFASSIFLSILIIKPNVFIQMFLLNINGFYYFVFILIFCVLLTILSLVLSLNSKVNASLSDIFANTYFKNIGEEIKEDGEVSKM